MNFYSLTEAPVRNDDLVFKQSPASSAFTVIFFFGITAGIFWAAHSFDGFGVLGGIVGSLFALLALYYFAQFRATLRPANWLLRANDIGLLIKYRSFQNYKLPPADIQVAQLAYSEITWARRATEDRATLRGSTRDTGSSRQANTLDFLDLCLAGGAAELDRRLRAEQAQASTAHSYCYDFPVRVLPDGIVRLRWHGDSAEYRISPNLGRALQALQRHIQLADTDVRSSDLASVGHLSDDELKAKVRTLIAGGDPIAACELAKRGLRCSMTEARHFVERLSSEGN